MAGDLEIGQLQAGIQALTTSITEIKDYLGHGIDRHTEVMGKLAVISSKQDDFSAYQHKCDDDRKSLHERIADIDRFQGNQIKVAGAIGALMAFLAYGGAKFVEKVIGWFA